MASQVIKVGMDVSEIKAGASEFVAEMQKQESAVFEFFTKMAQTNKEGEVTKQVIAGINQEGQQFEATLKKVASGWQVLSTKVKGSTDAMREFKTEQDRQAAAAGQARASTGSAAVSGSFDLSGLGLSQANSVETAIQRIRKVLADGSVSVERFQELLMKFKENPNAVMPNLTTQEAQIVKAFRSIQTSIESAAKANRRSASDATDDSQKRIDAANKEALRLSQQTQRRVDSGLAETTLRGAFDFSKIDPSRLNQIESALARVKGLIESGKISFQQFQDIFNKLKANPNQILPDLSPQEQAAARAIRTLVNGFGEQVPAAGEKSRSIFISLGGTLRLLEAQVLKRIFGTIENEILSSISAAQKFMVQIAEIRTISQDAQLSTETWSKRITELSSAFGKSQSDVAEAAYQTLSNQVAHGAESFKFLEEALKFSQASVSTATDSVNLLSGALRSFQLPMQDTERVAAIMFKTIELGRVRAKEMAETFGRVGTISKDAGVKLEEVSAAIALLTNRGIKFNDASTLIQNILLKLVRPTEEMKKLFAEWGVSSGTAAIATYGFQGVLQKLDQEAQKGTGRIGELLGQIRAIRGVIGLTGGAFGDFNDYLKKITNGQKDYNEAQKEVQASPGQKAAQQLTQLRNFFEQDFGEPFLKGLLRISDALGGTVNIIKGTIVAVELVTAGFVVWKAVQIANLPIMTANIALTGTWAGATGSLTAAFASATASLSALQVAGLGAWTSLGLLTTVALASGIVSYKLFFEQTTQSINNLTAAAKQFTDQQLKAREGTAKAEQQSFDKGVQQTVDTYTSRYKSILQFAANVVRSANETKDRAIEAYRQMTEQLKISAGTYFDTIREKLKAFSEAASEAKSQIKQSLKESEDLPRRGGARIFQEQLKYASSGYQDQFTGAIIGEQQIGLIENRIKELTARARAEFAKGTVESVGEARKLYNEIEQLQGHVFDKRVAQERKIFEFEAQAGRVTPTIGADGRLRYEFTVKTAEMEKKINETTQERLALEERYRKQQEQRKADAEKQALQEKERLRSLQQQFLLLEKIDIFTKEGKVKNEYRDSGGAERLLGEFDKRRDSILKLAGGDTKEGLQVFRDLAAQRAALVRELRTALQSETTGKIQEVITRDTQSVERLATKAREEFAKFQTEADRLTGGLNRQIALYGEKLLAPIGRTTEDAFQKAEPARQAALTKLEELKSARDAFNSSGGRTEENAKKIETAIKELNVALETYMKLRGLPAPESLTVAGDRSGLTIKDQIQALEGVGKQLLEGAQGIKQTQTQLAAARQELDGVDTKLRSMPAALQAMQESVSQVTPATQASFKTLAAAASEYADQLDRINRALQAQKAVPAVPRSPIPEGAGNYFGGYPATKYMNAGGFVGFVPRGSDQVPAMLGRDEYIMNAEATRQFMPLLKAMNAGSMPRYMNQGGPVTNVGDITVNVSGGRTDDQSLRNIAQGLRRGIRRGTISLDK